jgi:ribosomal protein L12E/L44/L45/RPP1/RPP2
MSEKGMNGISFRGRPGPTRGCRTNDDDDDEEEEEEDEEEEEEGEEDDKGSLFNISSSST